jgi:hypothetical protein
MVFAGPKFADAMDRAFETLVKRLSHQFHIGVREIARISNLFIQQSLGGIIIGEGGLHPAWQRRDAVTVFTHQG